MSNHIFAWKAVFVWNAVHNSPHLPTWDWQCFSRLRGWDQVFYSSEDQAKKRAEILNSMEKWDDNYPPDVVQRCDDILPDH